MSLFTLNFDPSDGSKIRQPQQILKESFLYVVCIALTAGIRGNHLADNFFTSNSVVIISHLQFK